MTIMDHKARLKQIDKLRKSIKKQNSQSISKKPQRFLPQPRDLKEKQMKQNNSRMHLITLPKFTDNFFDFLVVKMQIFL